MQRIRVTEYVDLDLDSKRWACNRCGHDLGSARDSYRRGCLVYDRDPREIHPPLIAGNYTFSPDPEWVRILEFYCPGCGAQVETEYLPPGHPITVDIDIDVDSLQSRIEAGELDMRDGRVVLVNDNVEVGTVPGGGAA